MGLDIGLFEHVQKGFRIPALPLFRDRLINVLTRMNLEVIEERMDRYRIALFIAWRRFGDNEQKGGVDVAEVCH